MAQVSWQKAISMWFAGRVEIVEVYENKKIKTVDEAIPVPSIVRFVGNVIKKFRFNRVVKFSRENVFIRDEGQCQYCGIEMTKANFTLDHIIPSSQGGKKVWSNIVACCKRCNQKKGNKSLKQAGMKLRRKPDTPVELVVENSKKFGRNIPKTWLDYIFWGEKWKAFLDSVITKWVNFFTSTKMVNGFSMASLIKKKIVFSTFAQLNTMASWLSAATFYREKALFLK